MLTYEYWMQLNVGQEKRVQGSGLQKYSSKAEFLNKVQSQNV